MSSIVDLSSDFELFSRFIALLHFCNFVNGEVGYVLYSVMLLHVGMDGIFNYYFCWGGRVGVIKLN